MSTAEAGMSTAVAGVEIKVMTSDPRWVPMYHSTGAAGADMCAAIQEPVVIAPGERKGIPTGLSLEIPEGYEVQIRPRSGLALRYGVSVLNAPGTIDSDYRGPVMVVLINHGTESFTVTEGMRIAQMVVAPVVQAQMVVSSELSTTERGVGGFGHTGYEKKIS